MCSLDIWWSVISEALKFLILLPKFLKHLELRDLFLWVEKTLNRLLIGDLYLSGNALFDVVLSKDFDMV